MTTARAVSTITSTEPARLAGVDACALLEEFLRSPEHAWSIGIEGAIGEFMHDAGEALAIARDERRLSGCTARGGLFLDLPETVILRAARRESGCAPGGVHRLDVLMPAERAAMPANTVLTELPDTGDGSGLLFDLGLGSPWIRFCVRSEDESLTAALRAAAGRGVFAHGNTVLQTLVEFSPPRVLVSAAGRLEVYGRVPERDERSPEAPHTHLLPHLLNSEPAGAADGFVPVLSLYPARPETDKYGRPRPRYDAEAAATLESLHARFGSAAA